MKFFIKFGLALSYKNTNLCTIHTSFSAIKRVSITIVSENTKNLQNSKYPNSASLAVNARDYFNVILKRRETFTKT